MIPTEAIEAALTALFPDAETVQGFTRAVQEPIVRTILEAAAAHMLAAPSYDDVFGAIYGATDKSGWAVSEVTEVVMALLDRPTP